MYIEPSLQTFQPNKKYDTQTKALRACAQSLTATNYILPRRPLFPHI